MTKCQVCIQDILAPNWDFLCDGIRKMGRELTKDLSLYECISTPFIMKLKSFANERKYLSERNEPLEIAAMDPGRGAQLEAMPGTLCPRKLAFSSQRPFTQMLGSLFSFILNLWAQTCSFSSEMVCFSRFGTAISNCNPWTKRKSAHYLSS